MLIGSVSWKCRCQMNHINYIVQQIYRITAIIQFKREVGNPLVSLLLAGSSSHTDSHNALWHYSDVILWRLKSPTLRLFTQPFIQAQIKENTKAPCHWPLCGGLSSDRWIPCTNGQSLERGKCSRPFHGAIMEPFWSYNPPDFDSRVPKHKP